MGNRVLAQALASLSQGGRATPLFSETVLAAPDIDSTVFQQLAHNFAKNSRRITLYASSNDEALILSKRIRGGLPRAGDSGDSILILPEVDTVDASGVDTSLLGHSYYGENRSVLSDIFHVSGMESRLLKDLG